MSTVRALVLRTVAVLVPALVATAVGVALPQAARAALCAGDAVWTGAAGNGLWSDSGNWRDVQAPSETLRAVIDTAAGALTDLSGTVCGLAVTGGTTDAPVSLKGDLAVTGLVDLAGSVQYLGGAAGLQAGSLATAPGTDLGLLDATAGVQVTGSGTLGATTVVHRLGDPVGSNPRLLLSGAVDLAGGAVTVQDVALDLSGALDLHGQALSLRGTGGSRLAAGAVVKDSSGGTGGTFSLESPATVDGSVSISSPARVVLATGAYLVSDPPSTFTGTGSLVWEAGVVVGSLTLDVDTIAQTGADKGWVGPANRLTVAAGRTLTFNSPSTVHLGGTLDNQGTVVVAPGATLIGVTDQGGILNPASGTLRVSQRAVGVTGSPVAVLDALPVSGSGIVSVAPGERLVLTRSAWTKDLPTTTRVTMEPGTTVRGGGVVQVAKGSVLATSGILNLVEGTTLELNDEADGTGGRIEARSTTLLGILNGTATNGTFRWSSGQVLGQLTVDKLTTDVPYNGAHDDTLQVGPLDDSARGRLALQGPLSLDTTRIVVAPHTDVLLSGDSTLKGVAGLSSSTTDATDSMLILTPTSTMTVVPTQALPIQIPVAAGVFDVPVVNQGTVLLGGSSMSANRGYLQDKPSGSTTDPTTAVLTSAPTADTPNPSPATLSAGSSTVVINAGLLYGNGVVKAATTTVRAARLIPYTAQGGTLSVDGDLVLTPDSEVQLFVGPIDPASTATPKELRHYRVAVTGTATLDGRITGLTKACPDAPEPCATSYVPVKNALATDAVKATKGIVGSFATSAWSPSSRGLGWKPVYRRTATAEDAESVDLQFVDVAPPSLGLAGIPAFTHFTTQRITYAAIDNPEGTGVGSFDVRWKRSSPSYSGGWSYPAAWQRTTRSYIDSSGLLAGSTYCYSVRARDRAGNLTGWSQPLCTTRLADDRAWSASTGWSRPGGVGGFLNGTFSRTTRAGAALHTAGTYQRVAVTALRCPTCGIVDVYAGSARLARVDLRSGSSVLRTWTSSALSTRTGSVTLRVVSSGKPVLIDAVALQRR